MKNTKTTKPRNTRRSLHAGVMPRYWHKVPPAEREKIVKESGMTMGVFMQKFKQPDWCDYPDALAGQMGCWSLMLSRRINSIKDCKSCDLCNAKRHNDGAKTRPPKPTDKQNR